MRTFSLSSAKRWICLLYTSCLNKFVILHFGLYLWEMEQTSIDKSHHRASEISILFKNVVTIIHFSIDVYKRQELFKHYSLPEYDKTGTYAEEYGIDIQSAKFIVTNNCILVSKLNPWTSRVICGTVSYTHLPIISNKLKRISSKLNITFVTLQQIVFRNLTIRYRNRRDVYKRQAISSSVRT